MSPATTTDPSHASPTAVAAVDRDWSFARRPAWVLSHVLVALLIIAMVGAGVWQVSRYREHDELRTRILEQTREAPVPIERLVSPDDPVARGTELEFRRVELRGTYDTSAEVAVRNRSYDGAPGRWVVTPLRLDSGGVVAVVRGWIGVDPRSGTLEADTPPFDDVLPPAGPVRVSGLIQPTQERGRFGAIDPAEGRLDELSRMDVSRLGRQVDGELYPVWVQMEQGGQDPPQAGRLPRPLKLELPDPSQNASYVGQWFIFATIAVFGYVVILRRQSRHQGVRSEAPVDGAPGERSQ